MCWTELPKKEKLVFPLPLPTKTMSPPEATADPPPIEIAQTPQRHFRMMRRMKRRPRKNQTKIPMTNRPRQLSPWKMKTPML
jgi:hypothetical protein